MEPPAEPSAPPAIAYQIPIALALSLVLILVSTLAFGLMSVSADHIDSAVRWHLLWRGCYWAGLALALSGAADLHRRVIGSSKLGARLALAAVIGLIAIAVLDLYMQHVYLQNVDWSHDVDTKRAMIEAVYTWRHRVHATSWLALCVGLIIAGWRVRTVRLLAAPLIVAMLVATPFDLYREHIARLFEGDRYRGVIIRGVFDAVATGLALAVLFASPTRREASPGYQRAARALDRTAASLYARLWIAVSSAVLVLVMFGMRGEHEGVAKLFGVGIPLANAIAGLVMVNGILGAAELTAPRTPRLRLYTGGAALMVTVAITSIQVLVLFRLILGERDSISSESAIVSAMPILMPALGLLALLLIGSGLHGIAEVLESQKLMARARASIVVVVIFQVISIAISGVMSTARHPGSLLFGLLAVAVAAVVALVSLARLCRAIAARLHERDELPVATLISR